MNHQEDDERLDAVFAALASPHRRRVVDVLASQPASIQQVAEQVGLSLTAINRHLAVLEAAGLIRRLKSGRVNFLAVRREGLLAVRRWLDGYSPHWGSDTETLENYVAAITRTPANKKESTP
ncbi:MAG: metalloregulator ArsR/SmtB family transcription factor [Pseudolysinimonas sp.]|uniref:ArsR/SmtB family transcription factor n=1 Tax=Pseudolysinimonas sp. TaxID=2680009 RepID=UPI003C75C5E7